jgi:hypothetical protein
MVYSIVLNVTDMPIGNSKIMESVPKQIVSNLTKINEKKDKSKEEFDLN